MHLSGVIAEITDLLVGLLPNEWSVLPRPVTRREMWHPPAAIIQSPRGTGVVRLDGGMDMAVDVLFVISDVDSDEGDIDQLYSIVDDGGVAEQMLDADTEHFHDMVVADWAVDDALLSGMTLLRGLRVSFTLAVPGT